MNWLRRLIEKNRQHATPPKRSRRFSLRKIGHFWVLDCRPYTSDRVGYRSWQKAVDELSSGRHFRRYGGTR